MSDRNRNWWKFGCVSGCRYGGMSYGLPLSLECPNCGKQMAILPPLIVMDDCLELLRVMVKVDGNRRTAKTYETVAFYEGQKIEPILQRMASRADG